MRTLVVRLGALGEATSIPVMSELLRSIDVTNYKLGIFGAALVILMLTRPEGIFPNRQRAMEMRGEIAEDTDMLGEDAMIDHAAGGVKA